MLNEAMDLAIKANYIAATPTEVTLRHRWLRVFVPVLQFIHYARFSPLLAWFLNALTWLERSPICLIEIYLKPNADLRVYFLHTYYFLLMCCPVSLLWYYAHSWNYFPCQLCSFANHFAWRLSWRFAFAWKRFNFIKTVICIHQWFHEFPYWECPITRTFANQ